MMHTYVLIQANDSIRASKWNTEKIEMNKTLVLQSCFVFFFLFFLTNK